MSDQRKIVIAAYRRIAKAKERGKGVRLSANEVYYIMEYDSGIRHAVESSYCESCGSDVDEGAGKRHEPILCDNCK